MRKPATVLFLAMTVCGAPVRAEDLPPPPRGADMTAVLAPTRMDDAALARAYKRGQARRNIGIGIAAPGVALSVLGAVLIGYGAKDPNLFGGGAEIASGLVVEGVGLALGVPGIIIWTTGQDEMDVVKWRRQQLGPPR